MYKLARVARDWLKCLLTDDEKSSSSASNSQYVCINYVKKFSLSYISHHSVMSVIICLSGYEMHWLLTCFFQFPDERVFVIKHSNTRRLLNVLNQQKV